MTAATLSKIDNPSRAQVEEKLGWTVARETIQLVSDGTEVQNHVANVRINKDGTKQVLGMVGPNFNIIQNATMMDLAETISRKDVPLQFGTAGYVGNGERVFFQCTGESFHVGDDDEITPYMLFANGHDGSLSCRMMPMTHRVFCSNQLANILNNCKSYVRIGHWGGDIHQKLRRAKELADGFFTTLKQNQVAMIDMRAKEVSTKQLSEYFADLYTRQIEAVSLNPQNEKEEKAKDRFDDAAKAFTKRFEHEKDVAGTTVWNMANAYTGWLQHTKHRMLATKSQRKLASTLFGEIQKQSVNAFQLALSS